MIKNVGKIHAAATYFAFVSRDITLSLRRLVSIPGRSDVGRKMKNGRSPWEM